MLDFLIQRGFSLCRESTLCIVSWNCGTLLQNRIKLVLFSAQQKATHLPSLNALNNSKPIVQSDNYMSTTNTSAFTVLQSLVCTAQQLYTSCYKVREDFVSLSISITLHRVILYDFSAISNAMLFTNKKVSFYHLCLIMALDCLLYTSPSPRDS